MLKIILPICAVFLASNPKRIWSSSFSTMMALSMVAIALIPTFHHSSPNTFMSMDLLSPALIALTLWISSLMMMASQKIIILNSHPTKFTLLTSSLCTILVAAFSLNNVISFYIMFEASLIPTFLLILGWGYQPERVQASSYLLMYTVTASLPLLLSIMLMNKWNNSLFFFFQMTNPLSLSTTAIWWTITIMAFLVKIPMYSVHLWLPKAHVEAPVAGSMILAAILLKLGAYGLIRMSGLFTMPSSEIKHLMISLALIGGVYSSLICMRQTDLKALIAYSSVGHMGPLIAGAMTSTTWGWQGALMIMIAHGFTSSALFAIANMTYETTQSRSVFLTKGMLSLFPAMSLLWFSLCVANMAGPPSINLLGEITLIAPILSANIWTALPLASLTFMAGAYSLHLYSTVNHGHTAAFSNPLSLFPPRNLNVIMLHTVPSFILFMKLDTMLPIM